MKKKLYVPDRRRLWHKKGLLYMKCLVITMLLSIMTVSAETFSQEQVVNLQLKNASILEVFNEIERQTELGFVYKSEQLNTSEKFNFRNSEISVAQVLDEVFGSDASISYKIIDNSVVIVKTNTAYERSAQQQTLTIKGKVNDVQGEPIPGVNIYEKNSPMNGVITGIDGNYTIQVDSPDDILVYSFIGFESQEVNVGGRSQINITLVEETKGIDEVVVVGYGTQKKSNVTGAVQQVSSKELENRTVLNAAQGLQGAIPNLNIYYGSGRATATPKINIRGFESISMDPDKSAPLIVIDGIPATVKEFTELNPNDIENVSSLMDAASAAIYGARAAFGVVLVTTKNAKKEGMEISYNNYFSFKNPTVTPEFELDPYLVNEAKVTGAGGWYDLNYIWGYNSWEHLEKMANGELPEVTLNPGQPNEYLYAGRTNWYEEAMKDFALSQSHNLSVSGRTDKMNYYFSGGYTREDGMFKYGNDIFDKYNLRAKLDFLLTDWFTLSNNSSYAHDVYDAPSQGFNYHGLYNSPTTMTIKNPDGSWTHSGAQIFGAASEGGRYNSYNSRYTTSFTAKVDVIKNLLTLTAKASFMRGNITDRSHWLPVDYKNGPELVQTIHPELDAENNSTVNRQNVYDLYTDLNKSFGKHNLHVLVGYNQEYRYYESFRAYRRDLISGSVPSINLATGEREVGEEIWDWATRSGFFRFNYDFDNKYMFEINGRYDGTSRFPKDDRFGFFPSISLGWNMVHEEFFSGINQYVSSLKPRFSYGSLGNQNVGAYDYLAPMQTQFDPRWPVSIISGEQPTSIYRPELVAASLTWETVETINYGLDFGFFRNRLSGSFDYYHRKTLDMLTKAKQLPAVLGTAEPKENAADLITKGWELVLSWRDAVNIGPSPLNYSLGITLADSRSWITKYDNPDGKLFDSGGYNDYYVGYEMGTIYGYEVDGLFQSEQELADHADQSQFWTYPGKVPPGAGDVKFNDLNGDGKIRSGQTVSDMQDMKVIGNSSSRYHIGLRGSADWKGFDFSMLWQGVLKRDWYPTDRYFWGLYYTPWTNLQKYHAENAWTPENTDAYLPRLKGYSASGWSGSELTKKNTRYMQDASYLRLKNITLGYSLPSSLINKLKLSQLRVFVSGENLVTFTGITNPNIDPERLNGSTYPMQKRISCGLSVKF